MERKTIIKIVIFVLVLGLVIEYFILILQKGGLDVEAVRFEKTDRYLNIASLKGKKLPIPAQATKKDDLHEAFAFKRSDLHEAMKDTFSEPEEEVEREIAEIKRFWDEKAKEDWLKISLKFKVEEADPSTTEREDKTLSPIKMVEDMQAARHKKPMVPIRRVLITYTITGKGRVLPVRMNMGQGKHSVLFGFPDTLLLEEDDVMLPNALLLGKDGTVKEIGKSAPILPDGLE